MEKKYQNFSKANLYYMPRKFLEFDYDDRLISAQSLLEKASLSNDAEKIKKRQKIVNSLMNKRPVIIMSQIEGNIMVLPITSQEAKKGLEHTHVEIKSLFRKKTDTKKERKTFVKISMPIMLSYNDFVKFNKVNKSKKNTKVSFAERIQIYKSALDIINSDDNLFYIDFN